MRRSLAALWVALPLATVALVLLAPGRWPALPLVVLSALAWLSPPVPGLAGRLLALLLSACAAWATLSGDPVGAMLYPVAVNLAFLGYFLLSLRSGQPAVERLARLEEPDLPADGVRYTRFLTKAWCVFFALNAALALLTVLQGDKVAWAVYNGFIGYVLMGAAILGERLLRPRLLRTRFWRSAATADLCGVLVADRALCHPVARGAAGLVTWSEFRERVLAKAGAISSATTQDWLVGEGDAVEFATGLLAVSMAGRHAIIPQNLRPDTVADLRRRFPGLQAVPVGKPRALPAAPAIVSRKSVVSFQTSGSTGSPALVSRPFGCLADEVAALERLWGSSLDGAEFAGTVPHHFIYGALFRVLWPLAAGRVFDVEPISDGFAIQARRMASPRLVLVSSPSVLSRLPEASPSPSPRPLAVFSSGSPLAEPDARRCAELLAPVAEVYGSTETGGIGWRLRDKGEGPWQALPGVALSKDVEGRLVIQSPFAPGRTAIVSDRAELLRDGGFRLLGRSDRIAKVEGRRVSLAELEDAIRAEEWVSGCAVFPLSEGGRLAVALVPRWSAAQPDYPAAVAALRARLALRHDPVAVPRTWRVLPVLPLDGRGKVTIEALRGSLHGSARQDVAPEAAFPLLLSHRCDGELAELQLHVPAELPIFAGHFPGHPILPGVSMIDWAARLSHAVFGFAATPSTVEQLKFNQPTFPGESVSLSLRMHRDCLHFSYRDAAGNPKAAGILRP